MREPWDRPTGAAVGRIRPVAEGIEDYLEHLRASAPASLDGLTVVVDCAQRRRVAGRPGGAAPRRRRRSSRSPPSRTAGTSTTAAAPRTWARCSGPSSSTAPTSGIAHDGDADRCLAVAADGRSSTATRSWPSSRWRCASPGRLAARHRRRRPSWPTSASGWPWSARASRSSRPPSVTATCSRRCATAATSLGGEQSGHVVLLDRRHDRRRRCSPPSRCWASVAATGTLARRPRRRHAAAAAGAHQRRRRRQGPGRRARRGSCRRSRPPRPSSGGRGRVLLRPSGTEAARARHGRGRLRGHGRRGRRTARRRRARGARARLSRTLDAHVRHRGIRR